jgi:hypothetical protein
LISDTNSGTLSATMTHAERLGCRPVARICAVERRDQDIRMQNAGAHARSPLRIRSR